MEQTKLDRINELARIAPAIDKTPALAYYSLSDLFSF